MKGHSSNLISIERNTTFCFSASWSRAEFASSTDLQNDMKIISRGVLYLQKGTIIMPIETHSSLVFYLYLLALFKTDGQFGLAITVPAQCVLMEADS